MRSSIQTCILNRVICTIVAGTFCLYVSAQDTIRSVSYQFENDQQYTTPKKANYSLENKNDKLYIDQKGREMVRYGLGLPADSDPAKIYNVDIQFDCKFLDGSPKSAIGLSVFFSHQIVLCL